MSDRSLLILAAAVAGRPGHADVRVAGGVITALATGLRPRAGEKVIEARGGALLPGLHDHHLHLLAMAAAATSVHCGPPAVTGAAQLRRVLAERSAVLQPGEWLRGVGYHEGVAGVLDRHALDQLVPDRPVRIQHRGGALWMVNTAGARALRLDRDESPDVERGPDTSPNGRLWRYDRRLRAALAGSAEVDLAAVGARLAEVGITGVTDASPELDGEGLRHLGAAVADGRLPVRVQVLTGHPDADGGLPAGLTRGPLKLVPRDHDLPGWDELVAALRHAGAAGRPVAVHCVTRESLLLTLAAIEEAGVAPGSRIEHAAVVPPEVRERMARLRLAVVTQPALVAERGDDYLCDVEVADREVLYPYRSLLRAGVRVAPSSDAPYTDVDPWHAIAAATTRRTRSGAVLGSRERVGARRVLAGYLSPLEDPGGPPRRLLVGGPADLCLLRVPLATALAEPDAGHVVLTLRAGDGRRR